MGGKCFRICTLWISHLIVCVTYLPRPCHSAPSSAESWLKYTTLSTTRSNRRCADSCFQSTNSSRIYKHAQNYVSSLHFSVVPRSSVCYTEKTAFPHPTTPCPPPSLYRHNENAHEASKHPKVIVFLTHSSLGCCRAVSSGFAPFLSRISTRSIPKTSRNFLRASETAWPM